MHPQLEAAWKKFQERITDIRKRAREATARAEAEKQKKKLDEVRRTIDQSYAQYAA